MMDKLTGSFLSKIFVLFMGLTFIFRQTKLMQAILCVQMSSLVEDLTTSYYLHSAGYDSEYYNEVMSIGLAPDDIPCLLKQRGTWAADNWRLFLFDNPLFKKGKLTIPQRLQYFELSLFHFAVTFIADSVKVRTLR